MKKINRRQFLQLSAGATLAALIGQPALPQTSAVAPTRKPKEFTLTAKWNYDHFITTVMVNDGTSVSTKKFVQQTHPHHAGSMRQAISYIASEIASFDLYHELCPLHEKILTGDEFLRAVAIKRKIESSTKKINGFNVYVNWAEVINAALGKSMYYDEYGNPKSGWDTIVCQA